MMDCVKTVLPSVALVFLILGFLGCNHGPETYEPVKQEVITFKVPPFDTPFNTSTDGASAQEAGAGKVSGMDIGSKGSDATGMAIGSKGDDDTGMDIPSEGGDVTGMNVASEKTDVDAGKTDASLEGAGVDISATHASSGISESDASLHISSIGQTDTSTDTLEGSQKAPQISARPGRDIPPGTDAPSISLDTLDLDSDAFESLLLVDEEKQYYSGQGKIDPFDPLVKDTPELPKERVVVEDEAPRRILTPLEKLDFSQMKLVAVLNRDAGSVAMVQESGGKGYLVNIGTYIGRNSGQVVKIEKDKLIIQEQVKDYQGNLIDRFQEMKLNKMDG
ncbi:MAG: pilus assembly protein PilP [Desulfamplus sp.]|nr:pilus assembly protein PilP [Desulfamplus sp.]